MIPYSHKHALVFTQNIVLDDDVSFSEKFVLYDDGTEPVDAIHDFTQKHSIELKFDGMKHALLPKLYKLVRCNRDRPSIWHNPITFEKKQLG